MKRAAALAALLVAALALSGCGETLQERAENREACESLGGTYVEYQSGWTYTYSDWDCNLSTKEGSE